jgi:hypothetical protein
MADPHSEPASGAGVVDQEAHPGVGAVLAFLQSRLPPEAFAHLREAIPNSEAMLSAFKANAEPTGGGFLEAVKGMAGKLFGGHDSATAQEHLAGMGLSVDQLRTLMPQLHSMLAGKIPPQVLEQIKQHVPGFGPAAEQ